MRRWILVSAFASVAALGQEQPARPPSGNAANPKALENALRGTRLIIVQPEGVFSEAATRARSCVVPLLEALVNPNVDRKMIVPLPKSNLDNMPIVQGLPTCSRDRLK
jgi:hypothetical protein